MKEQKILITGATGKTGRRVVERLKNKGITLRLAFRQGSPSFDWEKPETWAAVLEGIDTVYITFQPDLAIPTAADTIRQFTSMANRIGVRKMVLLSGRGEKEAQFCEQIVMNTATDWVVVRASWFHQNFSESVFLDPILAGVVALPRAEALEPFTDADDIADVVVEALLNDKHNGQIYELTGPRLMTFPQAIAEISAAIGSEIHFQALTLDENVNLLKSFQLPEGYIWLVNYLFTEVLDGRNSSITNDVEKVLGRKAKDFTAYAKETAATGIWNTVHANH